MEPRETTTATTTTMTAATTAASTSDFRLHTSDFGAPPPLPAPRTPVAVRPGTPADLPFIDALHKRHANALGFAPTKQLEGKIAAGQVLVAERVTGHSSLVTEGVTGHLSLVTRGAF